MELTAEIVDVPAQRGAVAAAVRALRPHQWTKNLLVFAGIIFAAKIGEVTRWLEALACLGAYCAASSACYLVNDVRDRETDRMHPLKRLFSNLKDAFAYFGLRAVFGRPSPAS